MQKDLWLFGGHREVGEDRKVLVWQRWVMLYTHKTIIQVLRSKSKAAVRC